MKKTNISTSDNIAEKMNDVTDSESSDYKYDSQSDDGDIVSKEKKFNAQSGEGYYMEVTYKDGGFRQFDAKTGELIGSSYESDQSSLPSLE